MKPILIFLGIFFICLSLAAASPACCPKLKSGGLCETMDSNSCSSLCEGGCIPNSCEQTQVCKTACCFDNSEGLCTPNVPKALCTSGSLIEDAKCNVPECALGCCILGKENQFVTQTRCEMLSSFYGVQINYKTEIYNEAGCILFGKEQDEGACVYENEGDKSCRFTTRQECSKVGQEFYNGFLCTSKDLGEICKTTKQTTCVDGKDEVYFLDSCGNIANIYDSSKINSQDYWNFVVEKSSSCNGDAKTCGNCDRIEKSSACRKGGGAEIGDNLCSSISCANAPAVSDAFGNVIARQDRQNGESWCVYDSYIGEGRDAVGSRNYKYSCQDGEVISEPCADYRSEICVENTQVVNNKQFSTSACSYNDDLTCLSYNMSNSEEVQKCRENPLCNARDFDFGESYKFSACTPAFPAGFDLSTKDGKEIAKSKCDIADFTCKKIKVCDWLTGCDCVAGCKCDSPEFTQKMNDFCASLGDCGGYVNINKKVTSGGYSSNGKKIDVNQYVVYATPQIGQKITGLINFEPLTLLFNVSSNLPKIKLDNDFYLDKIDNAWRNAFDRFGSTGFTFGDTKWDLSDNPITGIVTMGFAFTTTAVLGIMKIGSLVGLDWSGWFGLEDTEERSYTFNCEAWQAPSGGNDCGKCDDDPMKPCTQYKCKSLGQACQLINKDAKNPGCIWNNPGDATPPKISPDSNFISKGYKYDSISDDGFKIIKDNNDCMDAFSPIYFGIITDETAQCKFDLKRTTKWEEMDEEAVQNFNSMYEDKHAIALGFASADSIKGKLNKSLSESEIERIQMLIIDAYKNVTIYARCRDANGNYNLREFAIRTCVNPVDLTPPYIKKTSPKNGAYIPYDALSQEVGVWANERVDCRYDFSDGDYDAMKNNFSCENGERREGYFCSADVKEIRSTNKIFVRCKDNPQEKNESKRNKMIQRETIEFMKSSSALEIFSVSPENGMKLMFGNSPASVSLSIKTRGGENGKSICSWNYLEEKRVGDYFAGNSETHEATLELENGSYNIEFNCSDTAGNKAYAQTNFSIELDTKSPKIVRVYYASGLKVVTNEDASCSYSTNNCSFNFNTALRMGGLEREHVAEWRAGNYYIKCKDIWGNMESSCGIIVKADRNLKSEAQ